MSDQLQLIGDPKLDGKLVEGHIQIQKTKIDRGLIGGLLGSREDIARNVASVVALLASCALIVAAFSWGGQSDFGYKEAVASLSGLATLTIGYLFGRSSRD